MKKPKVNLEMKFFNRNLYKPKRWLISGLVGFTILPSCIPGDEEVLPESTEKIFVEYKSINSVKDIISVEDSIVKPVLYSSVISLENLPVEQKKKKFIDMILPSVLLSKYNLDKEKSKVAALNDQLNAIGYIEPADSVYLEQLMQEYRANSLDELEKKLTTHPVSIVLAQAALESGWGTSRFFLEGKNIFGVWSFSATEKRMKAAHGRNGKSIYVRKYDDFSESIHDYYKTIARVGAYRHFREKRIDSNNVYELISYLNRYSELGYTYVRRLESVIRKNNLTRFDHYYLNPDFIFNSEDKRTLLASAS